MTFLSSHQLHITPLSPVHIGCNETYDPTNYVIEGDAFYEFNTENAISGLSEMERKKLLQIVSGHSNEKMLKQVQSFFYEHRQALIAQAEHYFPVGKGVTDLYEKRIGKAAQIERGGKEVLNKLGIERSSYNLLDRKPMFPGSSIKGAIRTAMLNQVNAGARKQHHERNRELQQRLFDYSMRDLHKDPMRLVSIGDAHWRATDNTPGSEIRFAVNRKRRLKEGERLKQSMAEEKGLYQILECVSAMQPRSLATTLNLHHPDAAKGRQAKLPNAEFQWSIHDIAQACNDFYQKLFQLETEKMRKMGYLDAPWLEVIQHIFSPEMLHKLDNNEAFILRVGRHSGAEAVTLDGARKGSIKIMDGKKGKDHYQDAPTTWWLAAPATDSQSDTLPFGWLLVEINSDMSKPLPAHQAMARYTAERKTWFERQQKSKQQRLEQFIKKQAEEKQRQQAAEEKKQREAEQARLQAEKEKAQQAHRQAQLAQMHPVERQIAEYTVTLDAIKALENNQWQGEELKQAAEFIKTRMGHEKIWRETSKAKKPEKDKAYQRTLIVMKYLK
ncbi:MAG TPA: type III-A CRISPR-associated RAMP protein Csm5 [Gammaproteobacteria bacterium]|nr:type III-A CRISPR-associated RAMP protein Csm5 [Gammaproteobacteria bacterium]